MVFILAASSLHHAIKTLPQALQDYYKKGIYALPGLSFNPNALKVRKTAVSIDKKMKVIKRG